MMHFLLHVSFLQVLYKYAWSLIRTPVNFEKSRWHANTFARAGLGVVSWTEKPAKWHVFFSCQRDANSIVFKL